MPTFAKLFRRHVLGLTAVGLASLLPIPWALAGDPAPGGTLRYAIEAESDALLALTVTLAISRAAFAQSIGGLLNG